MFRIITELSENLLGIGFIFLASGVILFTVNFLLLRKSKRDKEILQATSQVSEIVDGGDRDA